ncbi:hypothetical protein MMC06_006307 [Schaereria dolodes]|nr:hypothetical protein [Schaereria dolodes]
MTAPSMHVTYPPASLLHFPPASDPSALYPPQSDHTFARPFDINPDLYNQLLNVEVPLTIALLYAATVTILNRTNKERGNKSWAFSKTKAFYAFVILHNVLLASYSFWTFAGMINAIRHSWPGWNGEYGLTGVVDTLCKINGPRGLGNAAAFSFSTGSWDVKNKAIRLLGGSPDSTDVGRIWNEGLAFYGWLFYLSKFYEVVDTLIVLAKGKNSSFLQTYHHAGAMLCMWAGVRYMSPPIWMFVLINSGIHGLMYTYYTLSALAVPIPTIVKRTITSLQIAQFIFGTCYAVAHLFIAYSIPVSTPYLFTYNISKVLPAVTSSISSAFTSATASAGAASWVKKLALRAAAQEGLAENVQNKDGELFGVDLSRHEEVEKARQEIRHRIEYPMVHCIDTSGQTFAILLNVLYLAPLTFLFVQFFVRAYTHRTSQSTTHPTHSAPIEKSARDAFRGVEREIHEALDSQQTNDVTEIPLELKAKLEEFRKEAEKYGHNAKITFEKEYDYVRGKGKEGYEKVKPKAKEAAEYAKVKGNEAYEQAKPKAKEAAEYAKAKGSEGYEKVKEGYEQAKPKAKEAAEYAKEKGKEGVDYVRGKSNEGYEKVQPKAKEAADYAKEKSTEGYEKAKVKGEEGYENARPKAADAAQNAKANAKEGADTIKQEGEDAKESGGEMASKAQENATNGEKDEDDGDGDGDGDGDDDGGDGKGEEEGDGEEEGEALDASAYEVKLDDIESPEEKNAEAELQPKEKGKP